MKRTWKIFYYEDENGRSDIQEFIDSQKERAQAKVFAWLSQLEQHGPNLPRPYADLLADGIHELRINLSGNQIRILYFFCFKEFIILTHAFSKRTSKVSKKEINKARKYREDFLARYELKKLREISDEKL